MLRGCLNCSRMNGDVSMNVSTNGSHLRRSDVEVTHCDRTPHRHPSPANLRHDNGLRVSLTTHRQESSRDRIRSDTRRACF
jgi:hypothetical protein